MEACDDAYFYDNRPSHLHEYQEMAIKYLFLDRPNQMLRIATAGTTEGQWARSTRDRLFLPLLNPTDEIPILYLLPMTCNSD